MQNLGQLVQTGGGGFGKRIVPEFPLPLFLVGLATISLGSLMRTLRLGRKEQTP